ncbi:MAG: PHP domain-containing protein [Oscillospiraceae bacterium]|nr:PHP domain-containing protein [Oscillospiraceae bacterium]
MQNILKKLNTGSAQDRLAALESLIKSETEPPKRSNLYANNHIHTFYSFSPYSPAAAVYFARAATLMTAGLMDHDSIAGADEFTRAGELAGVATTVGLECRVSLDGTALEGRLVNNPDQKSVAYMALHGVPRGRVKFLQDAFAPLREKRNARNRKMAANANAVLGAYGIDVDFDRDVLPLSKFTEGGSVTERHLMYAVCKKIVGTVGREGTAAFVEDQLRLPLSDKQRAQLADPANPYFDYDLLGTLKAGFIEGIYVSAADECMHLKSLSKLARETGALLCYAYLGDVGDSVTGDKKAQKFEDDYLGVLFDTLSENGVDAVTYMPSRNTIEQLTRIQNMCRERGFMEISGEDINSPRQKFICEQLAEPQFRHLIDATWALIRREESVGRD